MKQVILSIVIAAITLLPAASAQADNASLKMTGDTMVVVNGKDTVTISLGKLKEMAEKINDRLGDTLIDNAAADAAIAGTKATFNDEDNQREIALANIHYQNATKEKEFITMVTAIVCATILLIVFISLVAYYYLRRRAKYRIIEKAIENGYTLPDSFYGNTTVINQVPPMMPVPPVMPQQPNAPQQPFSNYEDVFARMRWHRGARSGFKMAVVALCLLTFALIIKEEIFAAIGFIFAIIAAAKLAIAYFDTRVPATPRAPQQPNAPQQPVTPPPFNDGRASGNTTTTTENNV